MWAGGDPLKVLQRVASAMGVASSATQRVQPLVFGEDESRPQVRARGHEVLSR